MQSVNQAGFKGTDRFVIEQRIGAGGFGIVYKAFDRVRSSTVALKTLHQANAEALFLFKREFRSLADVTHINLVTLYELLSDGDLWFFTMELVQGLNFLDYLRNQPESHLAPSTGGIPNHTLSAKYQTGDHHEVDTLRFNKNDLAVTGLNVERSSIATPIDFDRLRSSLRQLTEGIHAIHEAGKLHRDIKPPNVLITKEGRVVVLDFGLAVELAPQGQSHSTGNNEIVGTPAYMSPEQGCGQPVTQASDWYSVGIMLYQALTGELPFSGDFRTMVNAKLTFDASPPANLVDIPEEFNQLCIDLLRRDPEERPTAAEILQRLGTAPIEIQTALSQHREVPLVGRERHLKALHQAFQDTKEGNPVTVYIQGRSGMGKSSLVRKFLSELLHDKQETVLLTGRCFEQESVPYKAFDNIIDELSQFLKKLSRTKAEVLLPREVMALTRLFPVLLQVDAVAHSRRKVLETPDHQELRRRAFGALKELLTRVAKRYPLVLFIDDLQWGDLDSAAILTEILREPNAPSLLLLCSYRSEEAENSACLKELHAWQETLETEIDIRRLNIEELSLTEAKELALMLADEHHFITEARAAAIASEAGGNPFFVSELTRYSRTDGIGLEVCQLQISLPEVIQARVAMLSDDARHLLEVIAVAGHPLDRNAAKQATARDIDDHKTVAQLRSNHMIRVSGSGDREELETYHDRIRETLLTQLPVERLREHHLNLALTLEASGMAETEWLVNHFKGAGKTDKAVEYALIAATKASQALAFSRAAQLYRMAIELQKGESRDLKDLSIRLAEALIGDGRGSEAAEAFLVAAQQGSAEEAIDLQRRAAEQLLYSGHYDEGLKVISRVFKAMKIRLLPESPQFVVLSFFIWRTLIWFRGFGFNERTETELSRKDLLRLDTYSSVAIAVGQIDPLRGTEFQTRFLVYSLHAGEPNRVLRALYSEMSYQAALGKRSRNRVAMLANITTDLAKKYDNPYLSAMRGLTLGFAAFQQGVWQDAVHHYSEAEIIFRDKCTGVIPELDTVQYYCLCALQHIGEWKIVFDRLPSLLKEARERGDLYAETLMSIRYSYTVQLAADRVEKAEQDISETMQKWSQQGFHHQHYLEMVSRTQTALYRESGEGLAGWEYLSRNWQRLARSLFGMVEVVRIESQHLRARAALAAAIKTNDAKFFQEATRSVKKLRKEKSNWADGFANAIVASIACLQGRDKEALEKLREAEEQLKTANMMLYAMAVARCRGELIGGEEGSNLISTTDSWMFRQKIRNPARMTSMLLPGKWRR